MRSFIGVFMLLTVSGGTEVTFKGFPRKPVLLPCNCSGRDLAKEFRWQVEKKTGEQELVLKINTSVSDYGDKYRGRVKGLDNCSLHLENITAGDQGIYECCFYNPAYQYEKMNLVVCGVLSSKPVPGHDGLKVFQCDVNVCDNTSEIRWILDGRDLTNSSETNITIKKLSDAPADVGHISTLETKLNFSSNPECQLKDMTSLGAFSDPLLQTNTNYFRKCMKVIPVLSALGLSMVLFCRWKSLQRDY